MLGFSSADKAAEVGYLGVELGYSADKLEDIGRATAKPETVDTPIVNEFLLSPECRVAHAVTVGSHTQVMGEARRIVADESILDDKGKVVPEKPKSIIYDEEKLRYLPVGEKVADAFRIGAALNKRVDGARPT